MKKFVVFLLAVLVILLGVAYTKLFSRQTNYYKSVAAVNNGVLVLDNFDLGNIKIVTTDDDKITMDLTGDPDALAALDYQSDLLLTRFGLSRDWSGISGTIYVPEGTLLDITLSEDLSIRINDLAGEELIEGKKSFLVDTNGLNSVESGDSGVVVDGWGDVIVWDDEQWDIIADDLGGDDGVSGGDSGDDTEVILYCGVGSQAIRNYCCVTQNEDQAVPVCDGVGYWFFSNLERQCSYACDPLPEAEGEGEEGEEDDEPIDCGIGGQDERDTCCADQHIGEYQGCVGTWKYNNASGSCIFQCYTDDEYTEGSSGGEDDSYGDPTSDYCATISGAEDRDACCDDSLKNELSTGPRPGFPDCIGNWNFDETLGCDFECAEQAEMIRILNELKAKAREE